MDDDILNQWDLLDMTQEDGTIDEFWCNTHLGAMGLDRSIISEFIKRFNEELSKVKKNNPLPIKLMGRSVANRFYYFKKIDYNPILKELVREWEIDKIIEDE
tara:strand:+ start:2557 stop:2862 length:306 start_codon:yes stop_codon:yes gene_type:complete